MLALCKCARETVHSSESRKLPRFAKEKKHSSILEIKHCMVLQKGILQPFVRKKHCTVLKKQTPCMVLPNGRHIPFARNKTVHCVAKKKTLHGFPKQKTATFCTKNKHCMVLQKLNVAWFYKKLNVVWLYEKGDCNQLHKETLQGFQKYQNLSWLYKKRNINLLQEIEIVHGSKKQKQTLLAFTTQESSTFCAKKTPCTVLRNVTHYMVLQKKRVQPFTNTKILHVL